MFIAAHILSHYVCLSFSFFYFILLKAKSNVAWDQYTILKVVRLTCGLIKMSAWLRSKCKQNKMVTMFIYVVYVYQIYNLNICMLVYNTLLLQFINKEIKICPPYHLLEDVPFKELYSIISLKKCK